MSSEAAADKHSVRARQLLRRFWKKFEWPLVGAAGAGALALGFFGFGRFFAAVGESRSAWDL